MFLMHLSEAVSTGCQSRLYGGVGLAVLISTGERLRSTRGEVGGLFVCLFLMHPSEAVSTGCQSRLHGGVGLAVLISTGERLRSTRAEAGGRGRRERRPCSRVQGVEAGRGRRLSSGGLN